METTLGCEFVIFILMKSRLFRKFNLATFIQKGKKINTCKLPFKNNKSSTKKEGRKIIFFTHT